MSNYVSIKTNHFDMNKIFSRLRKQSWSVVAATDEKYFERKPKFSDVIDIEIGCDGNTDIIIRMKNEHWIQLYTRGVPPWQ